MLPSNDPAGGPSAWAVSASALIHRRAGWILLVATALTAVAILLVSNLRIDQELRRLLPDHFPSVTRLDRLSNEVGQQSHLYVTIRSPDRDANITFGEAIAERLEQREDVRYAIFRRDLSFFEDRALLYASLGDLVDLRRKVIARIREEVSKQAFGDIAADLEEDDATTESDEDREDDGDFLGFDPDEVREDYGVTEATHEFMEADEGRLMVVKVRPTSPSTDVEFSNALAADVHVLVEQLDPTAHHREMTVSLDGAYVQHAKQVKEVQNEVYAGAGAAATALLLSLVVYYRSLRAVLLIFVPLIASVVGALAFAWLVYGVLNLVSAFIFGVLLGLGIDFGIHVLSRLRQERGRGLDSTRALAVTLATSGRTTAAGAISTALAFAALVVADFQGFAQFGVVAAVGVVLALVAALVVMPALAVVLDRVSLWQPGPPSSDRVTPLTKTRWWRPFVGLGLSLAVVGVLCAGWSATQLDSLEFEHDLRQLGRRRSSDDGPRPASYRDAVGKGQTVDPMIALVDDPDQAASLQRQFEAIEAMTPEEVAAFDPNRPPTRALPAAPGDEAREGSGEAEGGAEAEPDEDLEEAFDDELEDWGDDDLEDPKFVGLEQLAVNQALMSADTAEILGRYTPEQLQVFKDRLQGVWSVYAFVPRLQAEKLAVIADIRQRIDDKKASLSEKTRRELEQWYRYLQVEAPIRVEDLPEYVRGQFEDQSGDPAGFVIIAARGSKADAHNARRIYDAFGELQTPTGAVEVAADFFVIPEIFAAIERDGPIVMGLAIGVMLLTAFVLLRDVSAAAGVAFTIGLSMLWLAGLMLLLDWKLNFFNIIVLPLLLGMGQDDALHLTQRHAEEGGKLGRVFKEAGGAIFVTTLTTVWGFAGILFANHRGLNSMAWTAVIGMTLALVASVVILPVLLELRRRRGP